MKLARIITISVFTLVNSARAAFIYLDEFQKQASPPRYDANMTFEICVPKTLNNLVMEDGFDKGDLWCHNLEGWIRMPEDQGGWLDISGMQLGFSTQEWTVWDYASACVIGLRESDLERLRGMSEEAAQANFEKMLSDESENSIPRILQQATALRALCHIRKDGVEWLMIELYFADRPPNLMALSLERKSANTHRFVDAKIQESPAILNTFIFFSNELSRAARKAMEDAIREGQTQENANAEAVSAENGEATEAESGE